MWLLLVAFGCTNPVTTPDWPALVAGAPVVGAAEGTLDLPVAP